jgi:hypothetical protein
MEDDRTTYIEQAVLKLQVEGVETCTLLKQILTVMNQQNQVTPQQQDQQPHWQELPKIIPPVPAIPPRSHRPHLLSSMRNKLMVKHS